MNTKGFLSENMPTILSITASAGVVGTGFAAMELGKELEKRTKQERKKKPLIFKACCTAGSALLTIGCILVSNKISKDRLELTKKELAETTAALGGVVKLLHDYRKHEEPERDKEIMDDLALKGCYKSPDEATEYEYDYNGNVLHFWKDQHIKDLSKGKYTCFKASEADVLAASNYVINTFCSDGVASYGMFYECLRERGVDIPEFPGEHDIIWEATNERWDYYGRGGLDFNYSVETDENGKEMNLIFFDDDDEMIKSFNSKLDSWRGSLARE